MSKLKPGNRLIIIGGAPRSGTTLVQNMLDSHPDILGGPEFLHIPDIIDLRKKLYKSISRKWIDLFCSYDDVDISIRSLIDAFLLPLADKHKCKYLSEKSPNNILVFPDLVNLLPGARFIHVIRDPRAIVASMLEVGLRARKKNIVAQDFTRSAFSAIQYVKKCFDAGFLVMRSSPEKVLTVTYEDLVQSPEEVTKKICNFLGTNWYPQMCLPSNKNHIGEKAITIKSNEIWYDARTYNSNPHINSINKWKNSLSPAQQIIICRSFQDYKELTQLGYDLSISSLDRYILLRGIIYSVLLILRNTTLRKLLGAFRKLELVIKRLV